VRIEHGVAACKELNHVVNEQLVFTVGQRPVHVQGYNMQGNSSHYENIQKRGLYITNK
jgi:hypothetical protein